MKKFLAMLLAVAIATTMSIPAFAADEGEDVATDHSESETGVSESADIGVYGTYKDTQYADTVLSVDVSWTSMNFRYAVSQQGTWNPETHTYKASESDPAWLEDTATITLANHSNSGVKASLGYTAIASGVTGTLSKNSVELATAEGTASTNPPSDSVTFQVSGAMSEGETSLGTITVSISEVKEAPKLDLTTASVDDYTTLIAEYMAEIDLDKNGGATVNLVLPTTSSENQGNAICDALYAYYDNDSSKLCDVVLSGVETVCTKMFNQKGLCLNSLRFTDATCIEEKGLTSCFTSATTLILDKVTRIGNYGLYKINDSETPSLTTIVFGSVIDTFGSSWIYRGTSGITVYVNENQGSTNSWSQPFCSEGTNETFPNGYIGGIYDFAAVKLGTP